MLRFNKKLVIYWLVFSLSCLSLYGCNNEEANADAAQNTDDQNTDGQVSDDNALQNAIAEALGDNDVAQAEDTADNGDASGASAEPVQKAIADRSPVEITRVEVPNPVATGSGDVLEPEKDTHDHEVTPNLFPVEKCQVEVNGIYQVKLAKDLLKEVNKRRADRSISALSPNTSLHACADARCKEQTYFIGHFRPDGSAFDSVGRGYVQGECIAIDYRTVNDIMEAWFAVNESRYQIMNPDYTQVGISIYDIEGIYYIAAEFGY